MNITLKIVNISTETAMKLHPSQGPLTSSSNTPLRHYRLHWHAAFPPMTVPRSDPTYFQFQAAWPMASHSYTWRMTWKSDSSQIMKKYYANHKKSRTFDCRF